MDEVRSIHHLEIFLSRHVQDGEATLRYLPPGDPDFEMIKQVRWISREEMKAIRYMPVLGKCRIA